MESVPPEIGNLGDLRFLTLSNNQLTSLPSEIGNLDSLSTLHSTRNQLTAVPPEIGNLSGLISLNLGWNQLTALPPEIGNLNSLRSLGLNDNQLTAVPPEIGNLSSLTSLSLGGNQLTAIPPEIGNLSSLTALYLNNNQLTTIPISIGNLSSLTIFTLSDNLLTAVPPEIGNLSSLAYLSLLGNQLTAIPPGIGNLSSLANLVLDNNQLVVISSEIENLTNLQKLYLNNNPLSGPLPGFLTSLNLQAFSFYATSLCVPDNAIIQNWLASMIYAGTGYICGQPAGGLSGIVTDHQGEPVPNAQILLYRALPRWYDWPSRILVSNVNTNSLGQYYFGNLGQDINYYLYFQESSGELAPEYHENQENLSSADPITITLGLTRTINAQLAAAQPPLVGVGIGSGAVTTSTNPLNGQVSILVPPGGATPLTLSYAATCASGETPIAVVLHYNQQPYPMTLANGQYQATIPAANVVASASLMITTTCDDGDATVTVGAVILYDPSGIITDAVTQQPVVGAIVVLHQVPGWQPRTGPADTRPNTCESNRSKPTGQPWSQPAPTDLGIIVNTEQTAVSPLVARQQTNNVGYYGWDVSEGCWYVTVEAEGYHPLTSPVVGVPPEVVDLNLQLIPQVNTLYLPLISKPVAPPPPSTVTPTPSVTTTPSVTATPTHAPQCIRPAYQTVTGRDLVVTGTTVNPTNPVAGQPVTVQVTIKNQGTVDVSPGNNFFTDVYLNRLPPGNDNTGSSSIGDLYWGVQGADLRAGHSLTLQKEFVFTQAGTHWLYAKVDTGLHVAEVNEDNNRFGGCSQERVVVTLATAATTPQPGNLNPLRLINEPNSRSTPTAHPPQSAVTPAP